MTPQKEPLRIDMTNLEQNRTQLSKCPYCGGDATLFLTSKDVNRQTSPETFRCFRCVACGLVFLDPIPKDMTPYYKGGYETIPESLTQLRRIAHKDRYRVNSITRHIKSGSLLEIGPWMGVFSCNAIDAGFNVTAIEMNADCVAFLQKTVGIEAVQSVRPEETLAAMERTFDVIVLWHCLEHLPKPWAVIEKASEKLNQGGILLIAVPNIESHDFSVLKERWLHLDIPRHLYQFSLAWLHGVAAKAGLQIAEATTNDRLSWILSKNAWHARASAMLPIRYLRGALGILLAWFALMRSGNSRGGGLTAVYRKP